MRSHRTHKRISALSLACLGIFALTSSAVYGATELVNPTGSSVRDLAASYQPTEKNITDSNLLNKVPGCKNITNKIQKSIKDLTSNPEDFIDTIDDFKNLIGDDVTTSDKSANTTLKKLSNFAEDDKFRSDCMDGIGYRLAKKQLADTTEKILTQAKTGNFGKPQFGDESSIFDGIKNTEINQALKTYGASSNAKAYPFGKNYARGLANSTQAQSNFNESARVNYGGGRSLQDILSAPFSWENWLSITQRPQNNPLGFTMLASQHLADQIGRKTEIQRDELNQNSGFLSQKRCVEYYPANPGPNGTVTPGTTCKKYQTVTPGSIIAEQIAAVVTSPIRQLELADGVNESLSGVFNKLMNQLGLQGLLGLSSFGNSGASFSVSDGSTFGSAFGSSGFGTSFSDTLDGETILSVNQGNGWNQEDPFNLTKDLGNTYIRTRPINYGSWDAQNNVPELIPGVGTKNTFYVVSVSGNTDLSLSENCVPVGFSDGTSSVCWKRGDIALFDGSGWRKVRYFNNLNENLGFKDPATGKKIQIIDRKGVIQVQNDYVQAVKGSMRELPNIVPALGKLDYCIPGPNPAWYDSAQLTAESIIAYMDAIQLDPNSLVLVMPNPFSFRTQYFGGKPWKQLNPKQWEFTFDNYFNIEQTLGDNLGSFFTAAFKTGGTFDQAIANAIRATQEAIEAQKEAAANGLQKRLGLYKGAIDKIYGQGSIMTTEFLVDAENEIVTENPNYLPMALSGMALTRNIRVYDLNIQQATQDYKDLVDESLSNIYRLNLIKRQVDEIIKAAQKRRAKELPPNTIPDACLIYENISYINEGATVSDLNAINGDMGATTTSGTDGTSAAGQGALGGGN